MEKILLPAIIVVSFFFTNCSITKEKDVELSPFLYSIDTINRQYDIGMTGSVAGGPDLHLTDSSQCRIYNCCSLNKLILIDHFSLGFGSFYQLNPNCEKQFTKKTENGIYLMNRAGDLYFYENNKTLPKIISNLNKDSILFKLGLDLEQFRPGSRMYVNVADSIMYIRLMKSFQATKGKYSRKDSGYPIFCKYNIVTEKKQFFGSQPKHIEHFYYGLHSVLYDLYIGDSIYTSECINGNITVINTLDNSVKTITSKSKFDTVEIKPFIIRKNMKDPKSLKMKHALLSPYYEALHYNPYNGYYYRIFHPALSEMNENGLFNTSYDKQCVLMIFDENLKLVDEKMLPIKTDRCFSLFPIENGIEMYIPDAFEFSESSSKYSFLKITHQKIK
jgi:hypothetical protein